MCHHQLQSSSVDAMHERAQNSVKLSDQPKAHALVTRNNALCTRLNYPSKFMIVQHHIMHFSTMDNQ